MKKRIIVFALLTLVCLGAAAAASAEVTNGRIVAEIEKIETYGATLHVVGWAYDTGNSAASLTLHVDNQTAYAADLARDDVNAAKGITGAHGFDFEYPWTVEGVRVTIAALYADNSGAYVIFDNIQVFPYVWTVSFDANGGADAPGAEVRHAGMNLRIPAATPTKAGYSFKGWANSAGGAAVYQPLDSYATDGDKTLYAVWEKSVCALTYDANGGEGAPEGQSASFGDSVILSDAVPEYEGRDFLGWSLTQGGEAAYQPGGTLTLRGDAKLYAVWQMKTYRIAYDANGGTGAPENQTKTYGTALVLSDTVPTRAEYVFLGWAESADAESPSYQPGGVYTAEAAATLYAVWEEVRLPGDVNGDKTVDGNDSALLLRYLANLPVEIKLRNADVNGDGTVNGKDALRLMKYLAGQQGIILE